MTTPPLQLRLQGIVTPLATPLLRQDVIDTTGTHQLIDHVIAGGVAGIFLLGSTGEGPSLSLAARHELVQYACHVVAQRVPVLVSVSDTALAATVAMAHVAAQAGADAVVLTTPYYFSMSQSELEQYVEHILETIPESMPLLLYNIPFLTHATWEPETVRRLATKHARIIGMKDSSGDMEYFCKLCDIKKQDRPDFIIMMGPEHLLPEAMRAGADGGVHGGSNVLPRLFVSLYQALVEERHNDKDNNDKKNDRTHKLIQGVNHFQEIYKVCNPTDHPFSRLIHGTKWALAAKHVISNVYVNQPFSSMTCQEQQMTSIQQILLNVEELIE